MICTELIVPAPSLSPKLVGKCIHPFVQQQQQQKLLPNHLRRLKRFNKSDLFIHENHSSADEFFKNSNCIYFFSNYSQSCFSARLYV